MKMKESVNGITVEIEQDNGKCYIRVFGKVRPAVTKVVNELQYSVMPPSWVMRQIIKNI